jgi:hypothetical protein
MHYGLTKKEVMNYLISLQWFWQKEAQVVGREWPCRWTMGHWFYEKKPVLFLWECLRPLAWLWLTNSMELRPCWEAASWAATQAFPNILWKPTVNYHAHKSTPLVPILCQINPDHTIPSYLSKIHLILSDLAFCFYAIDVQLQLLFTHRFFFIGTTMIADHHTKNSCLSKNI